jgi:hypothetical protein
VREEDEIRRFLAGEERPPAPAEAATAPHKGPH